MPILKKIYQVPHNTAGRPVAELLVLVKYDCGANEVEQIISIDVIIDGKAVANIEPVVSAIFEGMADQIFEDLDWHQLAYSEPENEIYEIQQF